LAVAFFLGGFGFVPECFGVGCPCWGGVWGYRENAKKKKEDTRRKILAGAAVLDEASKQPKFKAELYDLLGRFLTRDNDRALFGLVVQEVKKSDSVN
jgi:hypothetical protein